MANIQLKTLKFPGLTDTYVIPEVSISDPNKDGNVKLLFKIPPAVFTIRDTVYVGGDGSHQFDIGMTWAAWCSSSYNTFNLSATDEYVVAPGSYILYYDDDDNYTPVRPNDLIVNNGTYKIAY